MSGINQSKYVILPELCRVAKVATASRGPDWSKGQENVMQTSSHHSVHFIKGPHHHKAGKRLTPLQETNRTH